MFSHTILAFLTRSCGQRKPSEAILVPKAKLQNFFLIPVSDRLSFPKSLLTRNRLEVAGCRKDMKLCRKLLELLSFCGSQLLLPDEKNSKFQISKNFGKSRV